MIQRVLALLFTLAAIFQEGACWNDYQDIRTGRKDVYDSTTATGNIALTSMSLPQTFLITFTSALTATTSCGIGIVGFQTYITNQFSVNTTITNFIITELTLTARALDDTAITYLSINYIAVGVKAYFVQVQFYCFLPTVLSTGTGTRQETRTSTSLFTNQVLSCKVYLSGFRMHNSEGINNYLYAEVDCPSGSSNVNYVFSTAQNNTVSQICYTTIIFCEACTKGTAYYMEWGSVNQTILSYSTFPSTTNIKDTSTRYESSNRMFWGINIFNVSRGFQRSFNFQTNYYDLPSGGGSKYDVNYGTYVNSGTFFISLNHFFIATRQCNTSDGEWFIVKNQTCRKDINCPDANLTHTLHGTSKQFCSICDQSCLQCNGGLVNNCSSCDNQTFRSLVSNTCDCISGYVEIYKKSCIPCYNVIPGCNTCITTTVCLTCLTGFTLNMLGICQCNTGFLVTGVCTTLLGCISATNLQGTVYCLACNATLNYVRSTNFTCICNTGYYMNSVQDCVSVCGDSVVVKEQGCDDGNNITGDGCNSTCQVQPYYFCDNTKIPSACYIIANITGTVKYVQRQLSANEAVFAIKLDPYYNDFLFMDFRRFISTDLPCNQIKTNYINNLLMVYCQYPYTIQGKDFTLNLTLDTKFFRNGSTLSINLPASGMNAKLTYDSNYVLNGPLSIIVVILDVVAIIVLLLSSITERMIGVQMIQTLQSVLYGIALTKTCPATLAPLQLLRYSNGYNEMGGTDPARRYTYSFSISEVGLDQEFLLNYNVSYMILIGVIGLMLLLKSIMIKFQKDKAQQDQDFNRKFQMEQVHKSYKKVVKVYNFLFQRVFFLLCFMNMFLVIFSMAVQLSNQTPDYLMLGQEFNLLLCGIAVCTLITFLAMILINGAFPSTRIFPMFMNPKYPIYYVVYNSTFIILISFLYNQTWVLFFVLAMALGNLVYSLVFQPYHESIHNLTLALNQATIILALGAYLFEEMTSRTDNNEGIFTILVFVIILMLYICVALSIYRLYRFYHFMKLHKLSYHNDNQVEKNEDKQLLTLRANQNDVKIKEKEKLEPQANSNVLKNYEHEYYDNMKINKNPLNRTNDLNDSLQTKRENNHSPKKQARDNEDNYDTFSKNNTKYKDSSFRIQPIDPHPKPIKIDESPYNQFGQLRKTPKYNPNNNDEGEYDALKAIKARLKKDFYQKIRGTEYKQPSKLDLLDKSNNDKPANFTPDDIDDQ